MPRELLIGLIARFMTSECYLTYGSLAGMHRLVRHSLVHIALFEALNWKE